MATFFLKKSINTNPFLHKFLTPKSFSPSKLFIYSLHLVLQFFFFPREKMGKRKDSWRHNEEAILCQAWITITTDGATGTNQSADTMWERISAEYNAQKPATCVERSSDSCKARLDSTQSVIFNYKNNLIIL